MPWYVLQSPTGRVSVIFASARPPSAVGEYEEYGDARRREESLNQERTLTLVESTMARAWHSMDEPGVALEPTDPTIPVAWGCVYSEPPPSVNPNDYDPEQFSVTQFKKAFR